MRLRVRSESDLPQTSQLITQVLLSVCTRVWPRRVVTLVSSETVSRNAGCYLRVSSPWARPQISRESVCSPCPAPRSQHRGPRSCLPRAASGSSMAWVAAVLQLLLSCCHSRPPYLWFQVQLTKTSCCSFFRERFPKVAGVYRGRRLLEGRGSGVVEQRKPITVSCTQHSLGSVLISEMLHLSCYWRTH